MSQNCMLYVARFSRPNKSHENQLTVLRRFARQVEQHLEQLQKGAAPPRHNRQSRVDESSQGASQVYVPGASASSSAVPLSSVQMPTPQTVSPPPIPTPKDEDILAERECFFDFYSCTSPD